MSGPRRHITFIDSVRARSNGSRDKNPENDKAKSKRTTVLVVDDEHLIADTLTEILKRSGFKASCAYDGKAALQMALQITPDVVLSDVVMPHMNGVQLAIEIRKSLPSAEIILLSGQAWISDILKHWCREGDTFELISKPVHPEKILQRLRKKRRDDNHRTGNGAR